MEVHTFYQRLTWRYVLLYTLSLLENANKYIGEAIMIRNFGASFNFVFVNINIFVNNQHYDTTILE